MPESEYEKLEREEVERRLAYLEENVGDGQGDFGKGNWIAVWITIVASFILLVWGAFV
jgi:hypothetical protein